MSGVARLVGNPDTRQTNNGTDVTNVRLAFGGNKDREIAAFFCDAVIFGARGTSFANYHGKGDPVYVTGRLEVKTWTDRDGNVRESPTITVADWTFAGAGDHGSTGRNQNGANQRGNQHNGPQRGR